MQTIWRRRKKKTNLKFGKKNLIKKKSLFGAPHGGKEKYVEGIGIVKDGGP